jgi:RNA polymerase primary sigma factor
MSTESLPSEPELLPNNLIPEGFLTFKEAALSRAINYKMLQEWCKQGLKIRRRKINGKYRNLILASDIESFMPYIDDGRAELFAYRASPEGHDVVQRARVMAIGGATRSMTIQLLAKSMDIPHDEIEEMISIHEDIYPDRPIFIQSAKNVDKTKPRRNIAYIHSEEFTFENADEVIQGPAPEGRNEELEKAPAGQPPYLASLYTVPLLTKEEERHYTRLMNYLKYKAAQLAETWNGDMNIIDEQKVLLDRAAEIENFLLRSNLRLSVSISKKWLVPGIDLFELISEGNEALRNAVRGFDYMRGNKLSTYATHSIQRHFLRAIPRMKRWQQRNVSLDEGDRMLWLKDQRGGETEERVASHEQKKVLLQRIIGMLDGRERSILSLRFGLEPGSEQQTLEKLASRFGVTKERIRQIEGAALLKLKDFCMHGSKETRLMAAELFDMSEDASDVSEDD